MSPDSPRVLVIDDEPESIRLLVAFLRDLYPNVMVARDGFDGLEKAAKGAPDVILLDMSMPLLSGIDVCRRLKADPKLSHIPVIFLTAHSFIEEKLAAFAAGGVDYVTKPFSDREVLARIAVHSRANQRHRDRQAAGGDTHGAGQAPPPHPDQVLVGKVCEYLRANLSAHISLGDLAASLKVPESRLDSTFRKQLGLSVFDYSIELRMETARRLLRDTEMQIQQIAWTVGYANPGDLSRAFGQRFGMSPKRFRSEVVLGSRG